MSANSTLYCTAFYLAAQNGHTEVVAYLRTLNNQADEEEMRVATAMYLAAQNGHLAIVKELLEKDQRSAEPEPPVETGTFFINENVLKEEATVQYRPIVQPKHYTKIEMEDGNCRAFLVAAKENDRDALKRSINNGVDIECADGYGNTAMHHAAWNGCKDAIQVLIKAGANIRSKNRKIDMPIHLAACQGHSDVVKLFLDLSVFIDSKNKIGNTPLHCAVLSRKRDVVHLLVKEGASNCKNNEDKTPFDIATELYLMSAILIMLNDDDKVYLNKDIFGKAASRGHEHFLFELLKFEENINRKDVYGNTLLHIAATHGHINTVKMLIANGAKCYIFNNIKETEIMCAIKNHYIDIVDFFISKYAHTKETVEYAVRCGNVEIIERLLEARCNLVIYFDDLYRIAEKRGDASVLKCVQSYRRMLPTSSFGRQRQQVLISSSDSYSDEEDSDYNSSKRKKHRAR